MIRLTNEQAIEMMKAKLECMKRDVSGSDQVCNNKECDSCYLNYSQGNIGEQKEWLRMGIKALENQNTIIEELEKIKTELISCFSQENDIDSDPYNHALDIAISIIHDYIIELKGKPYDISNREM